MANSKSNRKIKYSEPAGYFPKELRDKIVKAGKAEKKAKDSKKK